MDPVLLVVIVALAVAVAVVRVWWHRRRAPVRRGANSHVRADGRPKVAYRNEQDALRAARAAAERTGAAMNAYRCRDCRDWHVGHRKPGV